MSTLQNIGLKTAGLLEYFSLNGQLFIWSDADENDRVTGQTSFAATTPTFCLDVPSGTTLMPLFVSLTQTGTVAGGAINMDISIETTKMRRASGGTAESNVIPTRTGSTLYNSGAPKSTLYSGATAAAAGTAVRIFAASMGADVDTAEGAVQGPYWSAEVPIFIEGPGSFLVFTYAASTGPTWEWSIGAAEFTTGANLPAYGE